MGGWIQESNTGTVVEMAHNLKAGLMATTTMVGSALAYSRAQGGETGEAQGQRTSSMTAGVSSSSTTAGQQQSHPGAKPEQHGNNKYQETVQQMMHWKY